MVCQTVKAGVNCIFMTKKGCSFNGGTCHTISDKCEGCDKIIETPTGKYCMMYPEPSAKWSVSGCPSATHIKNGVQEKTQKINPLKASKRKAGR
jgi:hypothetical protein